MLRVAFSVTVGLALSSPVHSQDLRRWHEVTGGHWSVPAAVVQDAARKLQQAANATMRPGRGKAPNLGAYHVQYQGVLRGKVRRVELSGACEVDASPEELSQAFRMVLDGGDCYFDAIYDPGTKRFTHFFFNGVA